MSAGVNRVILVGNLGKDPEVRYTEAKIPVAKFSLATSESWKDRITGEKKEITEWHNIVMWRSLAELAEKYLKKGSKIYLEGKLRSRSWKDKEGNTRYITEIIADSMTMLGTQGTKSDAETSQVPVIVENTQQPSPVATIEPAAVNDLPF